jgi:hypothetical protein
LGEHGQVRHERPPALHPPSISVDKIGHFVAVRPAPRHVPQRVAVLDQRTVGLARKPHIKAPAQPTRNKTGSVDVNLSFRDLITLAENRRSKRTASGFHSAVPSWPLKKINEVKKRGEVVFYLDQTDPRLLANLNSAILSQKG